MSALSSGSGLGPALPTPEDPLNLELLIDRPLGAQLVRDYISAEPGAVQFYGSHFRELAAYREKAAEVDERFDRDRRARAAQAMHAPGQDGEERLRRFVDEGGFIVTTGQQPALFGGPLYSIYKGLTTIRLAEALEAALGRTVLPLFWVASDDHDWEEANHTHVVDGAGGLHRIDVALPEGQEGRPLHRIALAEGLSAAVEEFTSYLPSTDYASGWHALIRRAYGNGSTLAQGFTRLLEELLGPLGLLFTDAADPALKAASADVLFAELGRSAKHEALLEERSGDITAAGYEVQATVMPGGVNLFLEGPAGRERLYRTDDGFRLRHSEVHVSAADVRARFDDDPRVLSPNVLLRPVVESAVFPTLSYVAGPGELAYFAEIQPLFDAHGIRMPVLFPRFGATAVESKVRKVMNKFHLDVRAFHKPRHELVAEVTREDVPPEVKSALGQLREAIGKGAEELLQATRPIDPTLKGPVTHARNAAFSAFTDAERKILQALKRQNEITLSQLQKAQIHLYPDGRPQERAMNVFYYLCRYGEGFLSELADRFVVELV